MQDTFIKIVLYVTAPLQSNGDKGHFLINENTQSYSSFSQCCNGGDIITFIEEFYRISNSEAIKKLYEITGTTQKYNSSEAKRKPRETAPAEAIKKDKEIIKMSEDNKKEINDLINNNIANIYSNEAKEYLISRGLSETLARKYKIFTANIYGYTKLVIPITELDKATNELKNISYVARAITPGDNVRYKNAPGEIIPFNRQYILTKQDKPIYITEGIFDSLSIEEAGGLAIALNSTSNLDKLCEYMKQNLEEAQKNIYVLALDNDKAGAEATKKLSKGLEELKIQYEKLNFDKEYKDINELYLSYSDKQGFKNVINPYYELTSANYLFNGYNKDKENIDFTYKQTGFSDLDNKLGGGIIPGLYVLGAISSLGKTTFIHQLADNLANKGEKILFFSIEQSKLELTTKTLSRSSYLMDKEKALTSLEFMQLKQEQEQQDNFILSVMEQSFNILDNTTIIEGNFDLTILKIKDIIEKYIRYTGVKPIVIVDYLQIITPVEARATDKQIADNNIKTLKQISRDNNLTIFAISSLNRDNYLKQIDFTSFKESGCIEYSADIVLGLQYTKIHEINENKVNEARATINVEKGKTPRDIELVCLKNRYGKANFKSYLKYYSKYNYFIENFDKNRLENMK